MEAEGWYHDPYERHEARWFSVGTATGLVRDGRQVGHDAAPSEVPTSPLVPWDPDTTEQSDSDLLRADRVQRGGRDKGEGMSKVVGVAFNPGNSEYW
jgi:hypothetical protein